MQKPLGRIEDLAASGTGQIPGVIPLVRVRSLSVTMRITFGGSIDADATVYVYYSPDGNNWDTIEYTSFAVTFDAGETVQRTIIIDPPEHGHICLKVTNGSSADALEDIIAWYSIQAWQGQTGQSRGLINTSNVYD